MDRRSFVGAATVSAVAPTLMACASHQTTPRATWVVLRRTDNGLVVLVDNTQVDLENLDSVVFAHAMAANPGRTDEDVRENVRIFVRSDPNVIYRDIVEVMNRIHFEKLGFVAEDVRR